MKLTNALTIDFEDWFCAANLSEAIEYNNWKNCELRIENNTKRILELLDNKEAKATFFILGWIAKRVPHLIQEIYKSGHEIASHGYSHNSLLSMTETEFESDFRKSLSVIKEILNIEIIGYRAPSFSITKDTIWIYKILTEYGIKYDSSVYPLRYHPDHRIPVSSLSPYVAYHDLLEIPLTSVQIMGIKIPCSGGGYFRLYPYWLSRYFLNLCNSQGRPFIFYLHPWEIDTNQPRMNIKPIKKFRHYYNIKNNFKKFELLLKDFQFNTIENLLKNKSLIV